MTFDKHYLVLWKLSLFSFCLAALTGFLYRCAGLGVLSPIAMPQNLKHAHSHLMFFNWLTVSLFIIVLQYCLPRTAEALQRRLIICIYTSLILGFLAYGLFLTFGYQSVVVVQRKLPLAAIVSGLVMLSWYYFIYNYFSYQRRSLSAGYSVDNRTTACQPRVIRQAFVGLIFCSLGAWSISIFQLKPLFNPFLVTTFTHFFLTVFIEGWAGLMVLGLLRSRLVVYNSDTYEKRFECLVLLGSLMIFPFALPRADVTSGLYYLAYVGLSFLIIGWSLTFLQLRAGRFSSPLDRVLLAMVAVKVFLMLAIFLPVPFWPGEHGLRIFYVHFMLLGLASMTILQITGAKESEWLRQLFMLTVLILLVSLILISGYWPAELFPANTYLIVAVVALLPVIPIFILLIKRHKTTELL